MSIGICGKSCETEFCALREELNCPGCRMGPGNPMYGDCAIAACARAKKMDGCEGCSGQLGCMELAVKELMPHRRKTAYEAKTAKAAVMSRRGPYMKRLFWGLFWLSILWMLDFSSFVGEGSAQYRSLQCLGDVFGFAMAMVMVALAQEERDYLVPGCIQAVLAIYNFLLHMMTVNGVEPDWAVFTALVTPYADLCLQWFLLKAHAETAPDVNPELGQKWRKLRKWYMGTMGVIVACDYLYLLLPMAITVIVTIAAVVFVVLSVIEMVYLYRMAKGYSRLCREL